MKPSIFSENRYNMWMLITIFASTLASTLSETMLQDALIVGLSVLAGTLAMLSGDKYEQTNT